MKKLILLFLFGLILNSAFGQHSITLKKVTTDTIRARVNSLYIKGLTSFSDTSVFQTPIYVNGNFFDGTSGSSITLGTANQIGFMNSTGTDLQWSDNFKWNDTTLTLNFGTNNIFIGRNSGKINTTGQSNVFMGIDAGSLNVSGAYNVYLGYEAGKASTNSYNLFIGYRAGLKNTSGQRNTFIGYQAGGNNLTGSNNVFIGDQSGGTNNATGNIFIGHLSAQNETGSNKLYIENSNSATPLIYGDFANDTVRINGTLDVTNTISGKGIMQIAKAEVLYTNQTQTTIITLPANAVVWQLGVEIITAFNDSGTDLINVGTGADFDKYTSTPWAPIEANVMGWNFEDTGSASFFPDTMTGSTNITFTYDGQNNDATQGQAFVYIHYSLH